MPVPAKVYLFLLAGAAFGAVGQVLFKVGATSRTALADFINSWICLGLMSYGLGTLIWIYALSKAPLTVVYPFTALTFVMVYGSGILLFGEQTSVRAGLGVGLVLVGLFLITDP
jgi:drug/metabolite transporter (DMT)-like permease